MTAVFDIPEKLLFNKLEQNSYTVLYNLYNVIQRFIGDNRLDRHSKYIK